MTVIIRNCPRCDAPVGAGFGCAHSTAATLLVSAHAAAQRAFHEMLDLGAYGDPTAPATLRYVAAERLVDDLLQNAQWETAKANLDALQAAEEHDALAAGDHYAGMAS